MSAAPSVQALRAATTVDQDSVEQITERVQEMLGAVLRRNDLTEDDVISILFTSTADLKSMFPATAARGMGFKTVPLIGAAEIAVPGSMPRCIRALLHITTTRQRDELHHVYLHRARELRDDLPD
jgi:chorismate mutase